MFSFFPPFLLFFSFCVVGSEGRAARSLLTPENFREDLSTGFPGLATNFGDNSTSSSKADFTRAPKGLEVSCVRRALHTCTDALSDAA